MLTLDKHAVTRAIDKLQCTLGQLKADLFALSSGHSHPLEINEALDGHRVIRGFADCVTGRVVHHHHLVAIALARVLHITVHLDVVVRGCNDVMSLLQVSEKEVSDRPVPNSKSGLDLAAAEG